MQKILLVEDDEDIRELFAETLREAGYEVDEAQNGLEALEQIEAGNEPYLLLLDLMMPVMTGPELLRALAERDRLKALAVVALSAGGTAEDVPLADKFLRKPVMPDLLLRAVREYCEPADPRTWVS